MTLAGADLPGSATEVAVTMTIPGLDGAWYVTAIPLAELAAERVPHALGQLPPDSVQLTPPCAGSLNTVAVSATEPLGVMLTNAGATYTDTCPGVVMTPVAEATAVESATALACSVTVAWSGGAAGAV